MKKQFQICVLVLSFITISFCSSQTIETKSKANLLPEGFSGEQINSLKDEKGNSIIPEDTTGDAFQIRNFNGFNIGDQYGISVASAGDVNGDSYNDLIIGAPYMESAGTDAGRAYIYFGGLNVNSVPDVILSGSNAYDYFGISVSTAGDVNGDGFSDVIVGAKGFSNFTGKAMIYYGGSIMNNTADLTITGDNESDFFGEPVSAAGDVNGDGYSDVVIGASNFSNAKGRISICFGGQNMNPTPDVIMTGENDGDQFGISVAAGDVNNDGFSDILAGANLNDSYTGKAYLFYGGTNMNNTADKTFNGESADNELGVSVAFAGDVNGDLYSDIIIGAVGYNGATGIVYIYNGGLDMDNSADVEINGISASGYFGASVSGAGDLNGDGYSDVIIGAPFDSYGKAYIYNGGLNMDNISDAKFEGENTVSYFGSTVTSAGDMNGDGYTDLIVGAEGYNSFTGKAYLYMEGMTGTYFPDLTMTGETGNTVLGYTLSSAGDVNGDGYSDIIIGSNIDKSYIYFGGANADNLVDLIITDGGTVSSAGDVNGDGYSDVFVGDYKYNTNTGRAYIYYGGSAMDNTADVIMTGEGTNGKFGSSVSSAGDVNGDGYSDVIVAAVLYPYTTTAGKAYIFYGGSSMNNVSDVSMTQGTGFATSVSAAGDLNADGYSDVIIGASFENSSTGKAYIYYGDSQMNPYADVILSGESLYQSFGISVSTAGDVNGDGFSDVIVGTYVNYLLSNFQRKAYIFYGSSIMDNIPDVTLITDGTSFNFGICVSEAGDLNRDGYSDVIVGAFGDANSIGRAQIFYGGVYMNTIADINISGPSGTFYGYSVSSAGDMNGDGNPDILAGARAYDISRGRVYVYYTSTPSVKPNLVSVRDVPDDQGGFVKLKWVKSGLDVSLNGSVSSYIVERSVPPGFSGFQWEQIGNVLPTQNNLYYYFTSSTPADSGINGNSTFYFRITAFTNSGNVLYRSNIMSGNSLDNISPAQVQLFTASASPGIVRLNWKRNTESDFYNYNIYRSTSTAIDPETETVFAALTDSTYLDSSPLTGIYYYFIVAKDIHNNKSIIASAEGQNITINLTAYIQGYFDQSSSSMVSDTIKTYLRNSAAPFAIVDSSKAILNSNGTAELKFGNAPAGNYYLVFKHRNSIETWSKGGGNSFVTGGTSAYNFTDSVTHAFGNNMKLLGTKYCIFNGDVSQDGFVDLTDIYSVYNDASLFVTGYKMTDVTGDNVTDLTDIVLTYNNSSSFVSVVKP